MSYVKYIPFINFIILIITCIDLLPKGILEIKPYTIELVISGETNLVKFYQNETETINLNTSIDKKKSPKAKL